MNMVIIDGTFDDIPIRTLYHGNKLNGMSMNNTYKFKDFDELIDKLKEKKPEMNINGLKEEDFICQRRIEYTYNTYRYTLSNNIDISNIKNNTLTYKDNYFPKQSERNYKSGIIMKNTNNEYKAFLLNETNLLTGEKNIDMIFSFDYSSGEKTADVLNLKPSTNSYENDDNFRYGIICISLFMYIVGTIMIIYPIVMFKKHKNKKKK